MKKLLFYLLIIPLFITSCINNEDVIEPGTANKQNSINIDPFVGVVVKSGDTNADTLDNGILIYAYENGETYSDSPFINGTIFKKGTTVWTSTPQYFWPSYDLDFYGYYPTTLKPTTTSVPTEFTYTVEISSTDQEDVVASAALKQSEETSVPMVFYHALSKITFTISTYENSGLNVQVNSISVNNIPLTGDFTMVPTATTASDYFTVSIPSTASSTDSATITPSTAISLTAGDATVTSSVIAGLYLIPQTLDNWTYSATDSYEMKGTYININAVLSGVTYYEGNIAVPITTTSWVPGTNYVYNITFGDYSSGNTGGGGYVPGSQTSDNKPEKVLTPITITATVTEWVDASDIDIDL